MEHKAAMETIKRRVNDLKVSCVEFFLISRPCPLSWQFAS
jgi:hypothetical protein